MDQPSLVPGSSVLDAELDQVKTTNEAVLASSGSTNLSRLLNASVKLEHERRKNPVAQLSYLRSLVESPPCLCVDCDKLKRYLELIDAEVFHLQLEIRIQNSTRWAKEQPAVVVKKPEPPSVTRSRRSTTTDDLMTGLDL